MMLMEEIFFSFTFGGEMLSLAAAKAVLQKLAHRPVVSQICENGQRIIDGVATILREHQLGDVFAIKGHPSWSFLTIADARGASSFEMKTLLMQELQQRGFLSVGTQNLNFANTGKCDNSLRFCSILFLTINFFQVCRIAFPSLFVFSKNFHRIIKTIRVLICTPH